MQVQLLVLLSGSLSVSTPGLCAESVGPHHDGPRKAGCWQVLGPWLGAGLMFIHRPPARGASRKFTLADASAESVGPPGGPSESRGAPVLGRSRHPPGVTAPPGGCHLGPGTHGYKLAATRSLAAKAGSESDPAGAAAGGTQPWRLAVARVAPGPPGSLPQAPSRRRLLVSGALSLSSHSGWQSCSCRSSLSEDLPTTRLRRRFRPSL